MHKTAVIIALNLALMTVAFRPVSAEVVNVPNSSFEGPAVASGLGVDIRIDSWQETPKPDWYDDTGDYTWDQLCGVFTNTPPEDPTHIDNCDGKQAMYLFAIPQVGVFQDYDTIDWSNSTPTHAFSARFEVGKSYHLAVGVIGGGGGMLEGASLLAGLYYRDSASNTVPIAATNIVHSKGIFPTNNHLVDFQVDLPTVMSTNAWAGQNIGIQIVSTAAQDRMGGYWDVDNVRLTAVAPSTFTLTAVRTENGLQISWLSRIGWQYQVRTSADLGTWADYDSPLAGTGAELSKLVPIGAASSGFFTVAASPGP